MTVKFTNNASTTVGTGINASATSLAVASASSFPSLSGADDYCYLTIQGATSTTREVVKATALSSNTFTIVRAQDNTSASTWSAGDIVELRMTAALLTDVIDAATVEGVKTNFQYTPTSGQTVFSGSDNASNTLIINQAALVSVYMNGVRLVQGTDYSVSSANNTVTLTVGATTADIIDIEVFGNFTGQSGAAVAITGGAISGTSVAATTLSASGTATLNTFVSNNATISGGSLDGVTIGGTTRGAISGNAISGTSFASTGNMTFGDNDKAIFGAGSDLQIYSDGTTGQVTGNVNVTGTVTASGEVFIAEKLTHTGDTDTHFKFAGANDIRIVAGNVEHAAFDGTIVLNQSGSSTMDFRVESDTQDHMLFVDASLNRIGVRTNSPNALLHVGGTAETQGSQANPAIQIGSTNGYRLGMYTDAEGGYIENKNGDNGLIFKVKTAGEAMRIVGGTGNVGIGVADGDVTGDGTAARTYVGIIGTANRGRLNLGSTASNGADAGTLAFTNGANSLADLTVDTTSGVQNTGTMYINGTRSIKIQAAATDEVVFNESGANVDFRVESDGNANMLFVDASADRLLLGGSSQDAGGTFAFTGGSGAIRHVHPAGTSKDNLMFAITGANNGFQTTVDASNLITYKFHTGGNVEAATFGTSESVFNEAGVARNFRVESTDNANMIKLDGANNRVGIGKSPASNPFEVAGYASFDSGASFSSRVGIFNTSPASYTGSASNSLVLGNSSSTTGSHGMTIVAGNQATSSIAFSDHAGDGGTTDYRGLFQYVHSDDSLRVFTASTERFRIASDGVANFNGDVKVLSGDIQMGNGRGINFSATADSSGTMSSETLDDYEEGTFTASLSAYTTDPTITEGKTFTAYYTKVGRKVTVTGYSGTKTITNVGAGGARITGLPFANMGGAYGVVVMAHNTMFGTHSGYVESGSSYWLPIVEASSSGVAYTTGSKYFMFQTTYFAS